MARSYWLVKTEPSTYSWAEMLAEKECYWDGVRNYQARNNLRAMKKRDRVLWYHSVKEKRILGVVEVTREHYPDPTTDDDRWSVVDVKPVLELKEPVHLKEIKADPELAEIALVRQSRLSVMPIPSEAYTKILAMGGGTQRVGQPAKKKAAKKKPAKKKTAKKKSS